MTRRSNSRSRRPAQRSPLPAARRIELGPDGHDYEVRPIPGARALKVYRCPGCDHEIRSGTAHVVVWPTDDGEGEDRRHWHTPCWANRANRGPTRKWS